eukprot:571456-Prymnesium_polylepis.1
MRPQCAHQSGTTSLETYQQHPGCAQRFRIAPQGGTPASEMRTTLGWQPLRPARGRSAWPRRTSRVARVNTCTFQQIA